MMIMRCDRCGGELEQGDEHVVVNGSRYDKRDRHFHSRRCFTSWAKDTAEMNIEIYGETEIDDGPGKPVKRDMVGNPTP